MDGWKRILGLGGICAAISVLVLGISFVTRTAAGSQLPLATTGDTIFRGAEACAECHAAEHGAWTGSGHALASSVESFRGAWVARGEPTLCLACHTTGYDPKSGQTALGGVSCESCHGHFRTGHPPSVMAKAEEPRACGDCHETTYTEWQLSVHARQGVTCVSCHAVHSQSPTTADGKLACASCHEERYQDFAHATHASAGADCETCHMHTAPIESMVGGQVATGHTFTVGATACASCHEDTIHTPSD